MKYPLPVIQSNPLINHEEYTEAMNQLVHIGKTEPVCDFDDAGNCFVARDWKGMPKSCCPTDCPQLGEKGCTTKNIQCKIYYCGAAKSKLSTNAKNTIDEIGMLLFNKYTKANNYEAPNLFFETEEEIKVLLQLK